MEVLDGCHILFDKEQPIFKTIDVKPEEQPIWKLAEGIGAKCFSDEDSSVTHVVATVSTTMMAQWARDNNKILVAPRWIESAHYFWK
jgi:RNA polymerase II C-terminal domain phosphatase-like 3/4